MAWPRKPVTIYDEDSGTYCIETILALITLLFLILSVGLHSSSNGLLICSSAGSLCGIVALIFSIAAIRNASRKDALPLRMLICCLLILCISFHLSTYDGLIRMSCLLKDRADHRSGRSFFALHSVSTLWLFLTGYDKIFLLLAYRFKNSRVHMGGLFIWICRNM